jgi:hypothetical protein
LSQAQTPLTLAPFSEQSGAVGGSEASAATQAKSDMSDTNIGVETKSK